jgi:hypothetical protein
MSWKDDYAKQYKLKTDSNGNKEWYNPKTNSFIKEEMNHVIQNIDNLLNGFYKLKDYVEANDIFDKSAEAACEYYYLDHVAETLLETQAEIRTIQSMYDRDNISMLDKLYMWAEISPCSLLMSSVYDHLKALDDAIEEYESKNVKVSGAYKSMTNIVRDVEFKHKKGDKK